MGLSKSRRRAFASSLAAIALLVGAGGSIATANPVDTISITGADYFESYAGSFLNVTARSGDHVAGCAGAACPDLAVTYSTDGSTFVTGAQTTMAPVFDGAVYLRHHLLIRLSNQAGIPSVIVPVAVRVTSSHSGFDDRPVADFLDNAPGFPPGYLFDFATRYQTPQDVATKVGQLATTYPELTTIIAAPEKTNGFRRRAQASMGCDVASPEAGNSLLPGSPGARPALFATPSVCADGDATSQAARAVVLTSKAVGDDDGVAMGNLITAQFTDPGTTDSPLSVDVTDNHIHVSLATNATGTLASTTDQVVAVINASPAASALVTATRYRNNALAAIPQPTPVVPLSDFLWAPNPGSPADDGYEVQRAPFATQVLRIGAIRDGSKVGVLVYAGLEADSWTGTLATLELAERLITNYATDPVTKVLLDHLDIFVVPAANPDGMNLSMLNGSLAVSHRKNLAVYCAPPSSVFTDPGSRLAWGVDLDRNFGEYSLFDGYAGASTSCDSDVSAGPSEYSEPETRNIKWLSDTFPNIKFAADVDSTGGYVMWPAGAYTAATRTGSPPLSFGIDAYFRQTTRAMLSALKAYRGTVFEPDRIGPAIDTLPGSAAGNSVDDMYYRRGILALQLRCGADIFSSTSTTSNTGTPVGPRPDYATEARHQGQECANGLTGLLATALAYAFDTAAPVTSAVPGSSSSTNPISVVFTSDEPADIYYTTNGSPPTVASTRYAAAGPGDTAGQTLTFTSDTTLKWLAVDVKGNQSAIQTATYTFGPKAALQTVLAGLQGVGPVNRDTDKKIGEAIAHLGKCLAAANWTDPSHVAPGKANKVFDECKAAVKNLLGIRNASPGLATSIDGWIDDIVGAARTLATTAIAEGGSAPALAKANKEVGKGDTDRANGKFEHAMDHYKNAWSALKP